MTGAPDPTRLGPSTEVRVLISRPLPEVWETFVPVYLPDLFPKAQGPIPPVVDVRDQTGRWDVVGHTRTVVLGDGNTALEEITFSAPSDGAKAAGRAEFAYTVSGFTGPFSWLVREAQGHWVFTPHQAGTEIVWTYGFQATSLVSRPLIGFLARTFWRAYMRDALMLFKALAERR